jgi:hypothetical protein
MCQHGLSVPHDSSEFPILDLTHAGQCSGLHCAASTAIAVSKGAVMNRRSNFLRCRRVPNLIERLVMEIPDGLVQPVLAADPTIAVDVDFEELKRTRTKKAILVFQGGGHPRVILQAPVKGKQQYGNNGNSLRSRGHTWCKAA